MTTSSGVHDSPADYAVLLIIRQNRSQRLQARTLRRLGAPYHRLE